MTLKQQLKKRLSEIGFRNSPVLQTLPLRPHCYKTTEGDTVLFANKSVTIFEGKDTTKTGKYCICFYYSGTKRLKFHKTFEDAEILKSTGVYSTFKDTMDAFDLWNKTSQSVITGWKRIA
jgi:hypothetical protein